MTAVATDRDLIGELEPVAEKLLERHLSMADEWFPHEYIPYSQGRDYGDWFEGAEEWTPDHSRLDGVARTSFYVNLMTEDNLPSYHREISSMFGKRDSAWNDWINRWTAEEGRHSIVMRDYLTVTRGVDPKDLERGRMEMIETGYQKEEDDALHGIAYVAFQELATRLSHRNTGKFSDDPVADRIMARVAADENLHMVFYRDMMQAALELAPSPAVIAIADEIIDFEMPGSVMSNFTRMAAQIADAGIYDIRGHQQEVVQPLVKKWRVFDVEGLDDAAERRRDELAEFLENLDARAEQFEEKREARRERRRRREERRNGDSTEA